MTGELSPAISLINFVDPQPFFSWSSAFSAAAHQLLLQSLIDPKGNSASAFAAANRLHSLKSLIDPECNSASAFTAAGHQHSLQ